MKLRFLWLVFAFLFVFPPRTLASGPAEGCTTVTVMIGDRLLFGDNFDTEWTGIYVWWAPAQVVVTPKGDKSLHGVFFEGLDNNSNASVNGYPQGGINDQGLCCGVNQLPSVPLYHPGTGEYCWFFSPIWQILWECGTVSDVIAWFESHYVGTSLGAQIHFADVSGDAVVVSAAADGTLTLTRKGNATYLVSTNFNLANPSSGLNATPCWRYETATSTLAKLQDQSDLTVEAMRDVLNATHQDSTAVSYVFDWIHRDVCLWENHNFSATANFNLDTELAKVVSGAEGVNMVPEAFLGPSGGVQGIFYVMMKEVRLADYFQPTGPPTLPTDLNGDGKVNIQDITIVAVAYKTRSGDPRWNPIADLDKNGEINIIDITTVARDYGKTI